MTFVQSRTPRTAGHPLVEPPSRLLDGQNAFVDVLSEGLAILGWVSMLRPFEMFLFDWWSIRRDLRLYHRLTAAKIVVAST